MPKLNKCAHISCPYLCFTREGCVSWAWLVCRTLKRGKEAERVSWGLVQNRVLWLHSFAQSVSLASGEDEIIIFDARAVHWLPL